MFSRLTRVGDKMKRSHILAFTTVLSLLIPYEMLALEAKNKSAPKQEIQERSTYMPPNYAMMLFTIFLIAGLLQNIPPQVQQEGA